MGLRQYINDYPEAYEGQEVCCTCAHYRQHYGYDKKWDIVRAMFYGHCVFSRIKHRRPDQTCDHWAPIEEEPVSES